MARRRGWLRLPDDLSRRSARLFRFVLEEVVAQLESENAPVDATTRHLVVVIMERGLRDACRPRLDCLATLARK